MFNSPKNIDSVALLRPTNLNPEELFIEEVKKDNEQEWEKRFRDQGDEKFQTAESRSKLLSDIKNVGSNKPIGYLPFYALIKICDVDPIKLATELRAKNLKVLFMKRSRIFAPALYVYDENALTLLLSKNRELLLREGWPLDPAQFVQKIQEEVVAPKTTLFNLVADAFADYTNQGRL